MVDPPEKREHPMALSKAFTTIGTVMMRSGWDEDAVFVGVHGGTSGVAHGQMDVGTFSIVRGKDRLVWDGRHTPYTLDYFSSPNRWHYETNNTSGHNVLKIGGEEQAFGKDVAAYLKQYEEAGTWCAVVYDLKDLYPKAQAYSRSFVFARPNLLVIVDRAKCEKTPASWEWLLQLTGRAAAPSAGLGSASR